MGDDPKLADNLKYPVFRKSTNDLILGDLLKSVFSVVSAPDNTVQSKLVSLINVAGFQPLFSKMNLNVIAKTSAKTASEEFTNV